MSETCFARGTCILVLPVGLFRGRAQRPCLPPGSCVASFEDGEADEEHSGCPCGENREAGPWRDRQGADVPGGLNRESGGHRPDLLNVAAPRV